MQAFGRGANESGRDRRLGSEMERRRPEPRGSRGRPEPTIVHRVGQHVNRLVPRGRGRGRDRDTEEDFEDVVDPSYLFSGLLFLVLLIFALSPGVLLTLPPGRGGIFMSGNTSTVAAFVHALLIVFILYVI